MADKKISELPLLNSVSGSSMIIPVVHDGTTVKVNLSQIGHYSSQWSAQTGSSNTFAGTQTFSGNVNINGRLTVHEVYANYETSSILYTSGSSQFGDAASDVHTFLGTINLNGLALGTPELMAQTASQAAVNLRISSTTGSINTTTSSFDSVFQRISSTTGSINTTTSSFDLVFRGISSVTGAINTTTSSFDSVFQRISSTTGSMNTTTSSFESVFVGISAVTGALNAFTSSVIGQTSTISAVTASIHFTTASLNTQTGSQDLVNRGISSVTGSINTTTSSFDLVFRGISSVTGAINTQSSSQDLVNRGISSVTGAINLTTSSLIGITNGLMAFTASLDNTYATDAQLYQLYQATASIHFATQSLNTQTGSQDLVNRGISSVTGSINTTTSSFNSVFLGISSVTGAINLTTSSLIGITNGLMAFTAALDNTYATDAQLYQLYQATASIHFATQSLNTQTGSQDLVNFGISSTTASLRAEIGGIEAYTASLKTAAIVSSSTQISNYYKFAETASANTTFYGNVTSNGNIQANKFVFTDGVISTNVGGQYIIATSGNTTYLYTGTSGLNINDSTNGAINVAITNAGAVTTRGGIQIGSPGNDQSLTFGGTNSSIYWGAGGPARMYYSVGDIKVSSNGASDVLNIQNIGGISVNGGITGSLMATNGVISGSVQLPEIAGIEAYTSSLKSAFTIDANNDVYFTGKITTQEVHTTYTTSSVLFQSGSTKFGNSSDDRHEFTGSVLVSHSFEVTEGSTGATKGDFFVDSPNKYVYVGRQSATSGDNTTFVVRDRTNTSRATIPGGGSIDTTFSTNASNFKVTNYSGTNLLNVSNVGNVTASGTFTVGGKAQIGTNTTDTSLGSNTKFGVVGDGSVNAGASQGSLFVAAGNEGGDTGLPINMGTAGATMMLLASINTSTGTATNSATYIVRFYFDGNNAPTTTYLGGSSDFVTFGVTPSNTLAVSGSSSGNKSYAWFINKFGA